MKFLKDNIFTKFGTPKIVIIDRDNQFCSKYFNELLTKYGVKRKIYTFIIQKQVAKRSLK